MSAAQSGTAVAQPVAGRRTRDPAARHWYVPVPAANLATAGGACRIGDVCLPRSACTRLPVEGQGQQADVHGQEADVHGQMPVGCGQMADVRDKRPVSADKRLMSMDHCLLAADKCLTSRDKWLMSAHFKLMSMDNRMLAGAAPATATRLPPKG